MDGGIKYTNSLLLSKLKNLYDNNLYRTHIYIYIYHTFNIGVHTVFVLLTTLCIIITYICYYSIYS